MVWEGLGGLVPVDGCQVQHPPGLLVPVALGNVVLSKEQTLPAHVANLASTQPRGFKILVGVFLPQTPWPSPSKAEGVFPGSAECSSSPGGAHW